MPVLTHDQAVAMGKKSKKRGSKNARADVLEIQRILLRDIRDASTTPLTRASCARAWEVLEERLRVLNGKPLPGQLRPDLEQRKAQRRRAPRSILSINPQDLPAGSTAEPSA